MKRRPAVTLMEVLIAMFIMAIGMLALLALFPVGAVSMAQALKDDRCAYASYMAENVAIANNLRYGDLVVNGFLNAPAGTGLVYVDPYAAQLGLSTLGSSLIPRVSPHFALTNVLAVRWLSLPDDITFNQSGYPDTLSTGLVVDRGRRYSIAYLLRRQVPVAVNPNTVPVQLYAVVYAGRPVKSLTAETTDTQAYITTSNSVQLSLPATIITIKRGGWILDTSGNFYRVTNIADGFNFLTKTVAPLLETQQGFPSAAVTADTTALLNGLPPPPYPIIMMDYVAEVFDKGYGWQQ